MYLVKTFSFLFLLGPFLIFAQEDSDEINWMHAIKKGPYENIEGNPYYMEWSKGDILLKNGTIYKDVNINYDIYEAKMHVKNESQGLIAVHSELIKEATIRVKPNLYRFKPILSEDINLSEKDGGKMYMRFFEVVFEGTKYAYYKLPIKIFSQINTMDTEKAYDVSKIEGTFASKQRYYLRDASGNYQILPPRKKAFLSALSEHSALLKAYIKTEKPNFGKHKDIHDMLSYLEQNI